jgi:uncharacterized membrane protein YedE/YeeE
MIMTLVATICLLFFIGYSSQRSGVCMVRAVREVIDRRRINRLAGFLLAAGSAMIVMALAEAVGARPYTTIIGTRPDGWAIAGGALFGLGTRIGGHCAIGLLAALTAGDLSRTASLAAMFAAAALLGPDMSQAAGMLPQRLPAISPLVENPKLGLILGGGLSTIAAGYIYLRLGWQRPRGGWSPLVAMTLIGTSSSILFALDQRWVYTSRISEVAYGEVAFTLGSVAGPIALVAGMLIASLTGRTFRMRLGKWRDWATAAGGGLLMGLGATMVPGGNDTMLFTGIPLLLPNLIVAYVAFFITLFIGMKMGKPDVGPPKDSRGDHVQ